MRLVKEWKASMAGLGKTSLLAALVAGFSPAAAATWDEVAKLRGSGEGEDPGTGRFGQNAAVDGDTAIFGATGDDSDSGAAYVFTRSNSGAWTRQAKLIPSNSRFGLQFGHSVDIDGNTAIVGNFEEDLNGFTDSAYIFVRDGSGRWREQATLEASDAVDGDAFAYSVAIDGNTALVGTRPESFTGFVDIPGAVYVFVRGANGRWTEKSKLLASDGEVGDTFGKYVALHGNVAIIGRPLNDLDDSNGTVRVSAYVFARNAAGNWSEKQKLLAGARTGSNGPFGPDVAVAAHGARALVTAGKAPGGRALAYVFSRTSSGVWRREGVLANNNTASNHFFGWSGDFSGNIAIIGAPVFGDDGRGAAYVFARNAEGDWRQQQKLLASDGELGDAFGHGVAATRQALLVGAPFDTVTGSDLTGSAYAFRRLAGPSVMQVQIGIEPAQATDEHSGRQVSVAILSNVDVAFDPLQTSIPTVRFGPGGAIATGYEVVDINADGVSDLVLQFDVQRTGVECDTGEAELSGVTFAGRKFAGNASVAPAACD